MWNNEAMRQAKIEETFQRMMRRRGMQIMKKQKFGKLPFKKHFCGYDREGDRMYGRILITKGITFCDFCGHEIKRGKKNARTSSKIKGLL